jgi:hypothetical protein
MRKLQYRAPRFAVDFPVRVTHGDSSQMTRGREISVDGMKLDLNGDSFPFTGGFIQLVDGISSLKIPFEVRTRAIDSIGIAFQNLSSEQSGALSDLIASLSRRPTCLSLVVRRSASARQAGRLRLSPIYL